MTAVDSKDALAVPADFKDALTALRDCDDNPMLAGREVRSALRADCGAFVAALFDESALSDDHPGLRFAVAILLRSDLLLPAIANPSVISSAHALRLTKCILEIDGNFINTLLTGLLTRRDMTDPACTLRVLDLIGECAPHLANWHPLVRIHASGNPQIRTKCASLLARFRFGDEAGIERFRGSEARVRANIVQTLWDQNRETASAVLEAAFQDDNNRVAGNACLALYKAGDTRALVRLAEMLRSPDPKNRITAAWVMGQSRDGRFAGRLLHALRGKDSALRKKSIASLAGLEPVPPWGPASPAPNPDDPGLFFVSAPDAPEPGCYELWLRVQRPDGGFMPHLRPIDFFVRAGEELLLDYSVEESVQDGDSVVRIVYPAASAVLERAFTESLAEKPAGQCWALSTYGTGAPKPSAAEAPRLEADAGALAALLESGPAFSRGVADAVNSVLSPDSSLAEQHLVLMLDGSGFDPETVRPLCAGKQIRLHCWRLCRNDGGSGLSGVFQSEEQAALVWPRFVASMRGRYTLRTKMAPTAVALRNADTKPARFFGCADLMKGGSNA